MKKIICIIMIIAVAVITLVSCGNYDMIDTNYTFDKAIIEMPDGSVKELDIRQWADYADGDQIQIIATDGKIYLVHSSKVILIRE